MPWPLTTCLILLGFFQLRFAMARRGSQSQVHLLGGLLCFSAGLLSWYLLGWVSWIAYLMFFLLIILPIAEIVLARRLNHTNQYWI